MLKTAVFAVIMSSFALNSFGENAKQWARIPYIFRADELSCVGYGNNKPGILLGTNKRLYKSIDAGYSWKDIFNAPSGGRKINDIVVLGNNLVYISTQNGVYLSKDDGDTWERCFRIKALKEKDIKSLAVTEDGQMYILTISKLYRSFDNGTTWEKVFFKDNSLSLDRADSGEQQDQEEFVDDDTTIALKKIRISANSIYLAANKAIYKSSDNGNSWEKIVLIGVDNINDIKISSMDEDITYIASDNGVFLHNQKTKGLTPIYSGLDDVCIKGITLLDEKEGRIMCISKNNIYKTYEPNKAGNGAHPDEFINEPTIKEVQAVAINYAEVNSEKIARWRKQAQMKGIMPKVSFNLDRSSSDTYEIYTSSNNNYCINGPKDNTDGWGVTLSWDLGDLVFNDIQNSIDVRSRLMVQLRDEILSDLTRIYFERRKIQIELASLPKDEMNNFIDKNLRVQELTASIDALTGGWFSSELEARQRK